MIFIVPTGVECYITRVSVSRRACTCEECDVSITSRLATTQYNIHTGPAQGHRQRAHTPRTVRDVDVGSRHSGRVPSGTAALRPGERLPGQVLVAYPLDDVPFQESAVSLCRAGLYGGPARHGLDLPRLNLPHAQTFFKLYKLLF